MTKPKGDPNTDEARRLLWALATSPWLGNRPWIATEVCIYFEHALIPGRDHCLCRKIMGPVPKRRETA